MTWEKSEVDGGVALGCEGRGIVVLVVLARGVKGDFPEGSTCCNESVGQSTGLTALLTALDEW